MALLDPGTELLLQQIATELAFVPVDGSSVSRFWAGCRLSVAVLFRSAAVAAGPQALAILRTGMGRAGALGMQAPMQGTMGAFRAAQWFRFALASSHSAGRRSR